MAIKSIFAFLVHPNKKAAEEVKPKGKSISLDGELFTFLSDIFERSNTECNIDVAFVPTDDGEPKNEFRNLLLVFSKTGTLDAATDIAHRLGLNTTNRSGLGLLFILRHQDNQSTRVLLSRFPTERAIMAEEGEAGLSVDYLEQVFLKNASTYKAALFMATNHGKSDLWDGRVVDKQINSIFGDASRYWVYDFLLSDFRTTSTQGTRRLARAILEASRATDANFEIKEELHFAAGVARNLNGQTISIEGFSQKMNLSQKTTELLKRNISDDMYKEKFIFNSDEYGRSISYRAVELSTGALVTAPSGEFQQIFNIEKVSKQGDQEIVRISTEGILLADRLTKSKR